MVRLLLRPYSIYIIVRTLQFFFKYSSSDFFWRAPENSTNNYPGLPISNKKDYPAIPTNGGFFFYFPNTHPLLVILLSTLVETLDRAPPAPTNRHKNKTSREVILGGRLADGK